MSDRINVIEIPAEKAKDASVPEVPAGQVWILKVELTFPVLPEDVTVKYEGDSAADFSARAFDRIRPALQQLADDTGAGYYANVRGMRRGI